MHVSSRDDPVVAQAVGAANTRALEIRRYARIRRVRQAGHMSPSRAAETDERQISAQGTWPTVALLSQARIAAKSGWTYHPEPEREFVQAELASSPESVAKTWL